MAFYLIGVFQHEHHHLFNNLLYFFYTNKSEGSNTSPKIVKGNKVTEVNGTDKVSLKESGYVFENIVFGKVKKAFTLKQLLFIGNENNDNLNTMNTEKNLMKFPTQKIM